jgi:hypothetical protein
MTRPDMIIALSPEGIERRKKMLEDALPEATIIKAAGLKLPDTKGRVIEIDFKEIGLKKRDWSLASLAVLSGKNTIVSKDMLEAGLAGRFRDPTLSVIKEIMNKVAGGL